MRYVSATVVVFLVYSLISLADFPFETARPLYIGARALGMGNAFTAIADGATAGFWNPAGLIQGQGVKIFGANKLNDRNEYAIDPKGIGYSYRGYGLFWGNKIALGVESGTPDFNYYAFARQFTAYGAVGTSIKFKRKHPSRRYQFFGTHPSYDVALLIKPYTQSEIWTPRTKFAQPVRHSMVDARGSISLAAIAVSLGYRVARVVPTPSGTLLWG